jgi:Uri superfamily endonuclease
VSAGGTYALLLHLNAHQTAVVGALGAVEFPPGWYLYIGSAHGPGGLAARLARHRRRAGKRFHWHVDYVRAVTELAEIWTSSDGIRRECTWAAAAATLPGAKVIAPGLGASDCQCLSHLFHFTQRPDLGEFKSLVHSELDCECINDDVGNNIG